MRQAAPTENGLRERTRRAVREEIIAVAMDLFLRRGFDATTVEEIAAAAGMSRRSFFRYFATKEDVVLSHLDVLGEGVATALAARPPEEDAWVALRRAFDVLLADAERDPRQSLALMHMLDGTVTLKARYVETQREWQDRLVPHVAARPGTPPEHGRPDPRAAAIVGAVLACLLAAREAWMATGGQTSIRNLFDVALAAVRPEAF